MRFAPENRDPRHDPSSRGGFAPSRPGPATRPAGRSGTLSRGGTPNRAGSEATSGVPSTVWAAPPEAAGPGWRPWVLATIRASFLPRHGRFVDLTPQFTRPDGDSTQEGERPSRHRPPHAVEVGSGQVVPFWVNLIDPDTPADVALTAPTARHTVIDARGPERTGRNGDLGGLEDARGEVDARPADLLADVVFVDLCDQPVDDRLGIVAARALRGGGVLAVLTRCTRTPVGDSGAGGGELVDPTGLVVASAQNGDLLYLQHIVIPTSPLLLPPAPPRPVADGGHPESAVTEAEPERAASDANVVSSGRQWAHPIGHVDLLVFASSRLGLPSRPDPDAETAPSGSGERCAAGAG